MKNLYSLQSVVYQEKSMKPFLKTSVLLFASILFAMPAGAAGKAEVEQVLLPPSEIVGKTLKFDYGEFVYSIAMRDETEVFWKLTEGQYSGPKQGTDKYVATKVADGIYLISWVEKSGLGLYNVINMKTGELITHARSGKATRVNLGTVSELK